MSIKKHFENCLSSHFQLFLFAVFGNPHSSKLCKYFFLFFYSNFFI